MEMAKILLIAVCILWALILVIYLLKKDIHDRKYNKVLLTKEQMLKNNEKKSIG